MLERLKTWLAEGLLLCAILLLGIFMGIALYVRWTSLGNIAALLPAESTDGFIIVNREDFSDLLARYNLNELFGTPLSELTFVGRDVAIAYVGGDRLTFYSVESQSGAEDFLDGLKAEEEEMIESGQVDCLTSLAMCFTFKGDFLIVASTEDPLLTLYGTGDSVAETGAYHNVRGRLPSLKSGMIYIDLKNARHEFLRVATEYGIPEPGFLESVFQIFPAFGASLRMEETGLYMESFTAVDKSILGGESYYHPSSKYEQELLPYTQPFALEWGGEDPFAQIQRVQEILDDLNGTAGLVFESELELWLVEFFGSPAVTEVEFLNSYATLLDDEYYFGFTPDEDFLFILELSNDDERQKAAELKDLFAANYRYSKTQTADNGEMKAELLSLEGSVKNWNGQDYYLFQADGETVAAVALTAEVAVVAGTESTLQATLDRISSGQNGRSLADFQVLLPGSDEIFILNGAFFPELSILETLLSTRKLFDDGVYTRSTLLLQ